MKRETFSRMIALLLVMCLYMGQVSAAGILREQDFEVAPNYSKMDTETAITTYLTREMKLNAAAICGILANIEYESGFSPTAWGDEGTSYGLCQWHESRCRSLFSFCWVNEYDVDSVQGQMEFLRYELENSYPFVLRYLQDVEDSSTGAYNTAWYWCYYFEIPAQRDVQAALRGNLAVENYTLRNTGH